MTYRTLRLAAWIAAPLLAAFAIHAWLASRDEQRRLSATLAAQKQLLDAADARERARQSALADTLAQIEKLKRATQTPEQIVRELPKYLPLPEPITLAPPGQGTNGPRDQEAVPGAPSFAPFAKGGEFIPSAPAAENLPGAPVAQIPAGDLKPLFDFVQDCRTCQARLAVAQQNTADDAAKISALTRERDAALTAARGGTFWRRLRRNALWFAVGAGAGAVAGLAASH